MRCPVVGQQLHLRRSRCKALPAFSWPRHHSYVFVALETHTVFVDTPTATAVSEAPPVQEAAPAQAFEVEDENVVAHIEVTYLRTIWDDIY